MPRDPSRGGSDGAFAQAGSDGSSPSGREQVGLFSRIRWILKPGSDLYRVYDHNWRRTPEALISMESQADLKLTYTHRF